MRHMMVSKVRGKFTKFGGELVTAEDLLGSSVTAEIDLASIETGSEQRDSHLRSPDFFDTENHPQMTYRSTGVRADGERLGARRRADAQGRHPQRAAEARGQRIRPGRLRRHPRWLHRDRPDQPRRLRRQPTTRRSRAAASWSPTRSTCTWRSRPFSRPRPTSEHHEGPWQRQAARGPSCVNELFRYESIARGLQLARQASGRRSAPCGARWASSAGRSALCLVR